jgi:peptidoglycan/xylan/chitin deacetylase (PgdA/CDA1 family)
VAASGHEVGSHTRSHVKASSWRVRLDPLRLRREIDESFDDLARELDTPPASLGMPYDVWTTRAARLAGRRYAAVRAGSPEPHYHHVQHIDWHRVRSWGPDAALPIETVCERISAIPPGHWLVLQFHSLADEGFQPLSPAKFERILQTIAASDGLHLVTLRDMAERYKNTSAVR